jgi:Mg-chelatase subunit ChlD
MQSLGEREAAVLKFIKLLIRILIEVVRALIKVIRALASVVRFMVALARKKKRVHPVRNHPEKAPGPVAPRRQPAVRGPDRIALVGFHDYAFVVARPAEPFASWLLDRSQQLHEKLGGRTNIAAGLWQALEILQATPRGVYRKIWLLSDGEPNIDVDAILPAVNACYRAHVNINTIGFGDEFDEPVLRQIAAQTHNGRFIPVNSLRSLTRTLTEMDLPAQHPRGRSETAVLVIDCSYSMSQPMEGRRKIEVVEEAIRHLIHYKQRLFA